MFAGFLLSNSLQWNKKAKNYHKRTPLRNIYIFRTKINHPGDQSSLLNGVVSWKSIWGLFFRNRTVFFKIFRSGMMLTDLPLPFTVRVHLRRADYPRCIKRCILELCIPLMKKVHDKHMDPLLPQHSSRR